MGSVDSKKSQLASDQQLVTGMKKDLPAGWVSQIAGQSVTLNQATSVVQGRIDTALAVAPAKAAYSQAVAAYNAQLSQTSSFVPALRTLLLAMFAQQSDKLADLGISPKKVTKRTAEATMVAVAKNLATREARGTVGKKAKKKIKGVVGPTISISTSTGNPGPTAAAGPASEASATSAPAHAASPGSGSGAPERA